MVINSFTDGFCNIVGALDGARYAGAAYTRLTARGSRVRQENYSTAAVGGKRCQGGVEKRTDVQMGFIADAINEDWMPY